MYICAYICNMELYVYNYINYKYINVTYSRKGLQ